MPMNFSSIGGGPTGTDASGDSGWRACRPATGVTGLGGGVPAH